MSKKDRTMRKQYARTIHVFMNDVFVDLELEQVPSNSIDIDREIVCRICKRPVHIITDTTEHGKFEDKHTLLMGCRPCEKAYLYNYTLSAIEIVE